MVPLDQLDPYALGISFLHKYAYVSTETVLAQAGIISQNIFPITLVSSASKRFNINGQDYLSRKMKNGRLYLTDGLGDQNGVLFADAKRAAKDMFYFNPKYYFDKKI